MLAALAIIAAACGSDGDDDSDGDGAQAAVTTAAAAQVTPIDFGASSGIVGEDPDFNLSALVWQGYWLSRDHFGPFVMGSGMGATFEPPMEMMQAAMAAVAQNPDDPVMLPQNLAPLQAVYASGDPGLVNDPREYGPLDFEAFRLDPATFDQTVRVRAQAETMLKESQWAHNFANAHFGTPDGDFGAQQRFIGQMVNLLATMQGKYAMEQLAGPKGLYLDGDGELDYTGNWVLLHAFSDIASLKAGAADGRYADDQMAPMFGGAASGLLDALADRTPATADEAASAIRALAYVAATVEGASADSAMTVLTRIAEELVDLETAGPADEGAALAGLISAGVATGDAGFLDAASIHLATLGSEFDAATGIFSSRSVYTADDVAWLIGGLNSAVQQGDPAVQAEAARMMVAFYEATISLGGMQLSAPPGKNGAMAGEWEKELPNVNYYHPVDTPPPPAAGALPVPAAEITWDGSAWSVTDRTFEVAGAMHLANELNWLGPHLGSLPFPSILDGGVANATSSSSDAAGGSDVEVTIVGENITFDRTSIQAEVGQTVTVTFDNRDVKVPHNFHVLGGSGADVKTEIVEGPVQQTLSFRIDEAGSYTFVCDIHPAQMKGTVEVG